MPSQHSDERSARKPIDGETRHRLKFITKAAAQEYAQHAGSAEAARYLRALVLLIEGA